MNEKFRGAGSSKLIPQNEQARCWVKVIASSSVAVLAHQQDLGRPTGEAQRRLDRLGQALADGVVADQPVHHHLDGVLLVAGEGDRGPVGQLDRLAVDPHPGEALPGEVVEQRAVLPLATPHHRGEHLEAGPLGQLHHPVDDLLGGLPGHRADRRWGSAVCRPGRRAGAGSRTPR